MRPEACAVPSSVKVLTDDVVLEPVVRYRESVDSDGCQGCVEMT